MYVWQSYCRVKVLLCPAPASVHPTNMSTSTEATQDYGASTHTVVFPVLPRAGVLVYVEKYGVCTFVCIHSLDTPRRQTLQPLPAWSCRLPWSPPVSQRCWIWPSQRYFPTLLLCVLKRLLNVKRSAAPSHWYVRTQRSDWWERSNEHEASEWLQGY